MANYHDGMYHQYSQAYPYDPYLFSMMPPVGPAMMPGGFPGPMAHGRSPADTKPTTEVVHMWIPNHVIGSLIGTKGAHIRDIMRITGAHIRVEQETSPTGNEPENFVSSDQQGKADIHGSPDSNRLITVSGTDMQQYRVSFCFHIYVMYFPSIHDFFKYRRSWKYLITLNISVGLTSMMRRCSAQK